MAAVQVPANITTSITFPRTPTQVLNMWHLHSKANKSIACAVGCVASTQAA
jgi:hypothetical protein